MASTSTCSRRGRAGGSRRPACAAVSGAALITSALAPGKRAIRACAAPGAAAAAAGAAALAAFCVAAAAPVRATLVEVASRPSPPDRRSAAARAGAARRRRAAGAPPDVVALTRPAGPGRSIERQDARHGRGVAAQDEELEDSHRQSPMTRPLRAAPPGRRRPSARSARRRSRGPRRTRSVTISNGGAVLIDAGDQAADAGQIVGVVGDHHAVAGRRWPAPGPAARPAAGSGSRPPRRRRCCADWKTSVANRTAPGPSTVAAPRLAAGLMR